MQLIVVNFKVNNQKSLKSGDLFVFGKPADTDWIVGDDKIKTFDYRVAFSEYKWKQKAKRSVPNECLGIWELDAENGWHLQEYWDGVEGVRMMLDYIIL